EHGLPARHTRDNRMIRLSSPSGVSYAALYDYLFGVTIPWEAYTMKHLKLLGKTLSDLHAILASYEAEYIPQVADEYFQIVERMRRYFSQSGVMRALQHKLDI